MNIAIWGAGKFGLYAGRQLIKKQNIICYIDNNAANMENVLGIKIVSPTEYEKCYSEKVDVVLVAVLDCCEIYEQLCQMKVEKFGIIDRLVYLYQLEISEDILKDINIIYNFELANKGYMRKLETNVVDFCNLNCKGCSHFSNIFSKRGGAIVGYESFERDIIHLSKKILIKHFDLLGGEAFLSERLADYIDCLRKYMPKTSITVVSNGLLIPKQKKELFLCMQRNQVIVSITEYPPTSKLRNEIIETLERWNIKYEFRKVVSDFGKNIDLMGENDPYKAQETCRESKCHFLRNGKIYKCPFSALGNYFFDKYDIPLHFEEGIDIYDESIDLSEALQKLDTEPIKLCRYCGKEERFTWEVSNTAPSSSDWIINA